MKENNRWHNLSVGEVIKLFETSPFHGLDQLEVNKRQEQYGKNKLPEEKRITAWEIFFDQFKSPMVYILLIAALISLGLKEFIDIGIILAAVLINAGIGFSQEYKAEATFKHLKKMVEHKARVIRTGRELIIDNQEVVPGDILILEAGDIVPADARLIETHNLETKEAILTGESEPSAKHTKPLKEDTPLADRENMVYFGTDITRGKGKAVVVATGSRAQVGTIAFLIKEAKVEKTPLQKKIAQLAQILGIVIGGLCILLFAGGILTGRPFLEILLTSVAVAVAGIPEGLLVAVTLTLAIGIQRMLERKALTKKLIATETLGSTTVICADKTGTLTEGKMAVAHIQPAKEKETTENLKIARLYNNAIIENPDQELEKWQISGDSTESALLLGAVQAGLERNEILAAYPRIDEIPFDSERMYMATLHYQKQNKKQNIICFKGAPERIVNLCQLREEEKEKIVQQFEQLTSKGLRVLALGQKEVSPRQKISERDIKKMTYLGLIALKDPLRQGAKETIADCLRAGIRPMILTGDHKLTTQTIAQEVGLIKEGETIIEGKEMDQMNDEQLKEILKTHHVFARVEPKHKIRIVDLLQEQNQVVAMTGDGVNDAPALRSADIGIALGSGSAVTKEIADIVLLDNNFKTIVEAIKQGRTIFSNIKKIVLFLLVDTFTEFILIGITFLFGYPLPLLAGHILWVNIIEDTLPAMALAYEKPREEVLKEKTRGHQAVILDKEMKFLIFIIGIVTDLLLLGLFFYLYYKNLDIDYIRTIIFVGLGINTLFIIFSCKNLKKSIWHYNPFDNKFLNLSVIIGWLLFLIPLYIPFFQNILRVVPLKLTDWAILVSFGLIALFLIEIGKLFFLPRQNKKKTYNQ